MTETTKPKKEKLSRQSMPHQDPMVRRKNFDEAALGYIEELALKEATRCIQCKNPTCIPGCPVEIDIKGFIKLISEKKYIEAVHLIKERSFLPAVCGRVCPQEDQCEKTCIIGKKQEPVAIGRLERFVADYEASHGEAILPNLPPSTGKKIAVVGAGPSGLTVAGDLIKLGHKVTVFEALHEPGGVLVYGIPEFRLPKAIVKREVDFLKKLGVEFKLNYVIGKIKTVDELLGVDGYDAVFLGNGAGLPKFMGIPGENLNGVYSANEYLTRVNLMKAYKFPEYDTPIIKGRRVAVVGGGNVAMDAVRTALRLGAEEAMIIYRRSEEEMPARREEVENAHEEGVIFKNLTNPVRIIGDEKGWVSALECLKMDLGAPDKSGRRSPVPIKGSEFQIPVDVVIIAVGTSAQPLIAASAKGIGINKRGYIIADEATGRTSKEGVYAGGDIVTGSATVILAMGAGRKAAKAIHEYVMNKPKNGR